LKQFDSVLWFATPVWAGELHVDNEAIKDFIYRLADISQGVSKSNYLGWQSESINEIEEPSVEVLLDQITQQVDLCCEQAALPKLYLQNFWFNINNPGAYNHLHNHPGSLISGVYYIDAFPEQGLFYFERNDDGKYFLPPVAEMNNVNSNCALYTPETGKCFIFPGWLNHSVSPNITDTNRISMSFNFGVPDEN